MTSRSTPRHLRRGDLSARCPPRHGRGHRVTAEGDQTPRRRIVMTNRTPRRNRAGSTGREAYRRDPPLTTIVSPSANATLSKEAWAASPTTTIRISRRDSPTENRRGNRAPGAAVGKSLTFPRSIRVAGLDEHKGVEMRPGHETSVLRTLERRGMRGLGGRVRVELAQVFRSSDGPCRVPGPTGRPRRTRRPQVLFAVEYISANAWATVGAAENDRLQGRTRDLEREQASALSEIGRVVRLEPVHERIGLLGDLDVPLILPGSTLTLFRRRPPGEGDCPCHQDECLRRQPAR